MGAYGSENLNKKFSHRIIFLKQPFFQIFPRVALMKVTFWHFEISNLISTKYETFLNMGPYVSENFKMHTPPTVRILSQATFF